MMVALGCGDGSVQMAPDSAVSPFTKIQAKQFQQAWADYLQSEVTITNSIEIQLRLIPPGEFLMGSPTSELGRNDQESQKFTKITKAFYLSVCEVTQEQYERVMGSNPSQFSASGDGQNEVSEIDTSRFPVENISSYEAMEFCRKLSMKEGVEYRLPTEAEWEHACRAGTTTAYSSGANISELDATGWFADNSGKAVIDSRDIWETDHDNYYKRLLVNVCRPHVVGSKKPNVWGLYDMHGNVWEWCEDCRKSDGRDQMLDDSIDPVQGNYRVLRGGAFRGLPLAVRSAFRYIIQPDNRGDDIGFRLVRTHNLSP